MIYLVSNQKELFTNELYSRISIEESLSIINSWKRVQFDIETNGLNPHLCDILCIQFGNKKDNIQIVVDTITVDILNYKNVLESKLLIGHNLKFDTQFLYSKGIIPNNVYDVMIVEQFLFLGFRHIAVLPEDYINYGYTYPYLSKLVEDKKSINYGKYVYTLSYSLKALSYKYLKISLDKSIRDNITVLGLVDEVIIYSAKDVEYLEDIMDKQIALLDKRQSKKGAKIECDFVLVLAYLEWCGIKLDETKWKNKMANDLENLNKSKKDLDLYALNHPKLTKWVKQNLQGDLFEGFNTEPIWSVDWQKKEAVKVVQALGFDTKVISKATKEEADSLMEKVLSNQTCIDDTFLQLYFDYQGYYKTVSSFGQGHLNLINPKTGRLHTNYWQIGTLSGRMSSGSGEDKEIAKLKNLKEVKMVNMQQLPHDPETRSCFVSEEGNLFCSCDYAAMEARIGAEVYDEKTLLDEFLYGSGDTHAAYAKVVYVKELEGINVKDVKKLRPDLRESVKAVEFAVQFGSDGTAAASKLKISIEEAKELVKNLLKNMKGLASFKETGSKKVRELGYVEAMPQTGHKVYWWDFKKWKQKQSSFTSEFWDNYKLYHKNTESDIAKEVKNHFKTASKWDRLALNIPTQGGGAVVLKDACISLFKWIKDNNYFGKILIVNLTHDECNSEFPKELEDIYPKIVAEIMEESAAKYYYKLPIPAAPAVGSHWIH